MIFRQRYFDDPEVGCSLATLVQSHAPATWIDPLLYFFTAQNDRTLLRIDLLVPTLAEYAHVLLEAAR